MNNIVVWVEKWYNRLEFKIDLNQRGADMSLKDKIKTFIHKYRHIWVASYAFLYMPWFMYLEKHVTSGYYVIHSTIDDKIPFIEYFVIPYLLWFVFIAAVFLYFFFSDVNDFYRLCKLMFTGMTIFLIISTLMPNGLNLRPVYFERENIFVDIVRQIYRIDTPTNVLPSLHVFNSLAACIAIWHSKKMRKHKVISWSAYTLAGLIILSTVFLKQHSVIDVMAAFLMAYVLHGFVYETEKSHVLEWKRQRIARGGFY